MPHCQVEYTANLRGDADIPGLLGKIAAKYRDSGGGLPVFGVRVRAIELADYVVNEGDPTDAFVHATCVIAPGRPEAFRRAFFGEMFEILKAHLAPAAKGRFLGVSLDVVEGGAGSYKFSF
ncbi:MAG: 5-carboxymethyl-2-hydroxymuconate isomerase [Sphingomonas sp.]